MSQAIQAMVDALHANPGPASERIAKNKQLRYLTLLPLLPINAETAKGKTDIAGSWNNEQKNLSEEVDPKTIENWLKKLCNLQLVKSRLERGVPHRPRTLYWTEPEKPTVKESVLRVVIAKAALDAVLGDSHPLDQVQEDKVRQAIEGSTELQYLTGAIRLLPSVIEPNTGNARSVVIEAIKTYRQARLTLGQKDVVLSVRGLVAASSGLFVVGHVGAAYGGPEVRVINLDQVEDAEVTKDRSSGAGNFSLDEYIDANRNLFG